MAHPTLNDIRALPDIISSDRFLLRMGNLPGGNNDRSLALKCVHVTLPGFGVETFNVKMYGHTVTHRGQRTYGHVLQASYVEDMNFNSAKVLYNWSESIASVNTGNGIGNKGAYENNNVTLYVYDQTGRVSASYDFIGFYFVSLQDSDLHGQSTQVLQHNATFNYDYFVPSYSNESIQNILTTFGINIDPLNQINQVFGTGRDTLGSIKNTIGGASNVLKKFTSSGLSVASIAKRFF